MKKYRLYNAKYTDIIIAASWEISDGCHMFFDKNHEIICAWPINNTLVEASQAYDEAKKLLNTPTEPDSNAKINHNVGDL
jgi:hypothetical protein